MITVASLQKSEPALHRVERIVAAALDAESRMVDDLGGVLAGRHEDTRMVAPFPRLLASWPAPSGRTPKARAGDITDLVVRRFLGGESSMEELLLALYCGNVSISRAEKIVQALWGDKADVALVSRHAGEIKQRILDWLRRPIARSYPYVFLQVIALKARTHETREWRRALVAVGVSAAGIREVLGVGLPSVSDNSSWGQFLGDLRGRGLGETQLILGENEPQLIAAAKEHYPGVPYQGDFAQMERTVLQNIPVTQLLVAADKLAEIRAAHPLNLRG